MLVACFACLACAWAAPGLCAAAELAKLKVGLRPERLGAGTTIEFSLQIAARSGLANETPAPLIAMKLTYPAGFILGTSELGLESCQPAALQALGPRACPTDSQIGKGSALVEVPFGSDAIEEHASVEMFVAPVKEEQVQMLFYVNGQSPVIAHVVFPAALSSASAPFGGALDTELPLVPTFPKAPDVSVLRFGSTLGPLGLTYYERVHGRTVAYSPQGIVLPKSCPAKGFPFTAELGFADGTEAVTNTRVSCPRAG
jgi:hypothetical protein